MLKVYREWQEQNCSVFWCEANHVQYETLQDASLIYDQVRSRTRKDEIQLTSCGEDVAPIQSVLALRFAEKAAYYAERRRYVWLADDLYDVCTGEESSLHDREIGPDNPKVVVCHKVVGGTMKIMTEVPKNKLSEAVADKVIDRVELQIDDPDLLEGLRELAQLPNYW